MANARALFDPQSSPLSSSLPDEIVLSFLARIWKSYYGSLCLVSKSFYSLLSSREIYAARAHIGSTEPRLYVCLWLRKKHRWFTLGEVEAELRLVPVRLSSSLPARLNSTAVAAGSEIYKIGGTVKGKGSRAVFVLDCQTHRWRCAPKMRVSRVGAKSFFLDGKIYVIGGCIKREEESRKWGEVFDLKTQTWKPLPSPPSDDSNHKVAVFGERIYVITKHNNYAYDPKEGRWLTKVDLQPIIGTRSGGKPITGPWCVIGNVMFTDDSSKYKWFCSRRGKWLRVEGLNDVYENRGYHCCRTIQLVNYGGKLLILWHKWNLSIVEKIIWCAVIRLEERMSPHFGPQIWGEVERCNVVMPSVPKSYKLSSCQCVLV